MEKAVFDDIIEELKDEIPTEHLRTYDEVMGTLRGIQDLNKKKEIELKEPEIIELLYLFVSEWSLRALSVGDVDKEDHATQYLYRGIFTTISNSALSIIKLCQDGLEYQANVVQRSLLEICSLLLTITIDNTARNELISSPKDNTEYKVWKKHFTAKKMDTTISSYENSIGNIQKGSFMDVWRNEAYHKLSSFVHNDFVSFLGFSYSDAQNIDDKVFLNIVGHYATRGGIILRQVSQWLFYTGMFFTKLMVDPNIEINKEILCNDTELWNEAATFHFITHKYFMIILSNEEDEESIV